MTTISNISMVIASPGISFVISVREEKYIEETDVSFEA